MKYDITHLENAALERTYGHLDNRFYQFMEGAESDAAKEFHQQGMYTEAEVLKMLEDYGEHYMCHISQYCDQNEIMDPIEFFEPFKTEKNHEQETL